MTDPQRFAALVASLAPASKLLSAQPLTGGVSAQITALELEHPDGTREKVVVREYGAADLATDPHVAEHEYTLLRHLHAANLPVPRPLAFDQSAALLPTPALVIAFVDGETVFSPTDLDATLRQLATQLVRIHQQPAAAFPFLPDLTPRRAANIRQRPAHLDASLDEGRIRTALEPVFPPSQHNPNTLLHGDYWLGNILWKGGQIAAIIDWEDAATGDPLADLATARLELVFAFGMDAAQQFTRHYQAQTALDYTNLPLWDLYAALLPAHKLAEWAGDPATERRWRAGHAAFVAQAIERLE
jgi:aminoglycoside phosphotransferase (APT) family kinase protein